jgi:hypothetical protein
VSKSAYWALSQPTLRTLPATVQNPFMEHKRKNPKHAGVELDVYDDQGNRHLIYLVSRPGNIGYELAASGLPVNDPGNGAFQLPGHFSKIVRLRPKAGERRVRTIRTWHDTGGPWRVRINAHPHGSSRFHWRLSWPRQ